MGRGGKREVADVMRFGMVVVKRPEVMKAEGRETN